MSESEAKKCPKCGGVMESVESVGTYRDVRLYGEKLGFFGSKILPFCCKDCGYIEFYKEMKKNKE